MFKQIFQYCAGFRGVLGIVRYCAGLTELCGPAPAHPVRRPDSIMFFFLGCGGNYHKKCAYKIPNNCSDSRHRASTNISGINSIPHSHTLPRPSSQIGGLGDSLLLQQSNSLSDSIPSLKDRRATWGGRPVWIEPALSGRIQVPHTFAIHSYKKPTVCQICKRLVSAVHWKTTFTHSCE